MSQWTEVQRVARNLIEIRVKLSERLKIGNTFAVCLSGKKRRQRTRFTRMHYECRPTHRGAVETLTFALSLHYVGNARSMLERLEMTTTASRFKQYRPHNVTSVHIIQISKF